MPAMRKRTVRTLVSFFFTDSLTDAWERKLGPDECPIKIQQAASRQSGNDTFRFVFKLNQQDNASGMLVPFLLSQLDGNAGDRSNPSSDEEMFPGNNKANEYKCHNIQNIKFNNHNVSSYQFKQDTVKTSNIKKYEYENKPILKYRR